MAVDGLCICPLASGSRGNAVYVSGGGTSVLVDAGLSGVELERRLAARNLSPESLSAVLISHEHTDHVRGAGVMSRRYNIPLYINPKTHAESSAKLGRVQHLTYFHCGRPFTLGDISINPFSISHDAMDPAGFTLSCGGVKAGIATDLGIATNLVKEHLKGCSLLYLEANHDSEMLQNGPYPWHLKQRIKSRRGHLSNMDSGRLLCEIRSDRLSHVILAHLSEENNHPEKALQTVRHVFDTTGIQVEVAMPDVPGKVVHLKGIPEEAVRLS